MQLHVDDDAFVRAPATLVYPRLTDIGAWPDWWPGVRVRPLSAPGEAERWALELRGRRLATRWRPVRVGARPHGWRHDTGVVLDLRGDLTGSAELWLEAHNGGTVIHHVLLAQAERARPLGVLRTWREAMRRGLWALKDDLQSQERARAGMSP